MNLKFKQLICLLLISYSSFGQNFEIQFREYFASRSCQDIGLQMYFPFPFKSKKFITGVEFRSVSWGNQTGLVLGYRSYLADRAKYTFSGQANVFLDVALFRPAPMFAPSISYDFTFRWYTKRRIYFLANFGLRYNMCVGYEAYGDNTQLEAPFGIGIGWQRKREINY